MAASWRGPGSTWLARVSVRNPRGRAGSDEQQSRRDQFQLVRKSMARSTSWARDAARAEAACPAANSIAARVVMSHRADETTADGGPRATTGAHAAAGRATPATCQASAEFFLRPGQAAAHRPSRARSSP